MHLEHHDVSYVRVSRAPLEKIQAYKQRMGWTARWVSSYGSDFNYDFGVSFTKEALAKGRIDYNYATIADEKYLFDELPGLSVFYKDENGDVFHTYSSYARGNEEVIGAPSSTSTSPPRAATKRRSWTGCGATMNTRTSSGPTPAVPRKYP